MRNRIALVLFCLSLSALCSSQRIDDTAGNSNPFIQAITKASEDFPGPFPVLSAAEPDGSLVVASGNFNNADITIIVVKSRIDEFKPKVMRLISMLHRPKTYVHIKRARVIGSFDLEFNDYIQRDGNFSRSTVPLGQVVEEVKQWGLPQPLGVVIRGNKHADIRFHGEKIETMKLMWPKELSAHDTVEVTVERHWYGLVTLIAMGSFFLFALALLFWSTIKKTPPIEKPAVIQERPKTLLEAQARYDSPKSKKANRVLLLIPLASIAIITLMPIGMEDAGNWMPKLNVVSPILSFVLLGPLTVGIVIRLFRRRPPPKADVPDIVRFAPFIFIPVLLLLFIVLIQSFAPQWLYAIPRVPFLWITRFLGYSPLVLLIIGLYLYTRKSTERLGPGDTDYDMAAELARKANIKLRKVFVMKKSKGTNAFANQFGNIGLTQGAREKLSDKDRRCVIAHELGHVKGRHVQWLILFSLAFWSLQFGSLIWIEKSKVSEFTMGLVKAISSPIVFLPLLFIVRSPFQRKAEFSADKFALEVIGSFDDVAIALAKVHLQNASPHTFTKFHESTASHPSLVKRLNSLRDTAIKMGIPVPANEVERIISTLSIEEESARQVESWDHSGE